MAAAETATILIRDRYELLGPVAAGGEARVVKAIDRQHERLVALKIRAVRSELGRDELLREARVLLALPPNPALPLVREDFFVDDEYVVVLDWVEGTNLATLVRDRGTPGLAPSSVLAYLAEVAEALTFLHAQNPPIVHGDVKPANVILTRGGHVKLVDFGLSSTLGMEGQRAGTVGFRAPELAAGALPSRATDIYSLAATAFALLTGAPPAGALPSWEGVDPAQASQLERVLREGLATEPAHRPTTPGEFIERLRAGWGSTLPTGVMTFCMTDIADSTTLWERDPAAMARALVTHDDLIATAVERHGGRFLKSMGEGDSTVSVFESATAAVAGTLAAQQALATEAWPSATPIQVRFGLHTGEAERHDTTYVGTTVNLAARVRGEASASEVLLSAETAAVVDGHLPAGCTLVDLGAHRLKGLKFPTQIHALAGPGLAAVLPADACPYRGLLAFEPEDRGFFFGREGVVASILGRLAPGRLLAVVGASGSGKSSLLRAGVIAAVQAGQVEGVVAAQLITPGPEPMAGVAVPADTLLVVDQFEELYTQWHDDGARTAFLDTLLASTGPVVIGLRADFYGELAANAALAEAVATNQILLGPMQEADLRRAVEEPARLAGLRLGPGLVDIILRDVAGEPGTLPLMSHALRETWERRNGRTLTVAAYQESGGVSSAVAQTADAVARAVPENQQTLLRNVFLRLTEVGDGLEETRRRVRIDELVPEGIPPETIRSMLHRLADARLLTLEEDTAEVAHEVLIRKWPTLRDWLEEDREGIRLHRRLGDTAHLWDAAGREAADLYRGSRLDAAVEWAEANPGRVNRAERAFLDAGLEAEQHERQEELRVNRRLRRLLVGAGSLLLVGLGLLVFALISRHNAVGAEASARSQAFATEAQAQIGRDPQRAILLARLALAAAPTPQAQLAASEALDANTVLSQLPSLGSQQCTATRVVLIDRGRSVAIGTCKGDVAIQDLLNGRIVRRIHVGTPPSWMEMSPTGRTLLLAADHDIMRVGLRDGVVRRVYRAPFDISRVAMSPTGEVAFVSGNAIFLLDLRTHQLRRLLTTDPTVNYVSKMQWASRDQLLVATIGQGAGTGELPGGLTEIDIRSSARRSIPLTRPSERPASTGVSISPDRHTWYITGATIDKGSGRQTATTWAVDQRSRRVRWTAYGPIGTYPCHSAAASSDGRLVAVGYCQGTSDVFDAQSGQLVIHENGANSGIRWIGFTPDSKRVLTYADDGSVRTWNTQGSEKLRVQLGNDPAIGFTPDGHNLMVSGSRGKILDRSTGRVIRAFHGFPAKVVVNGCAASCFSALPQLRRLAYMTSTPQGVRVVETDGSTGKVVGTIASPKAEKVGVLQDGRILTAYTAAGLQLHATVADPRNGRVRQLDPGPAGGGRGCIAKTPTFNSSDTLVAIGDACQLIDVWNLVTERLVRSIHIPNRQTGAPVVLTPDGRYALAMALGGALVRVDLRTGKVNERPGANSEGKALAVSPDGRFYVLGRYDASVEVYDARTLRIVRQHNIGSPVLSVAFSPDSRDLAVEGQDHLLRVWDTCTICENPQALKHATAKASVRSLTSSERQTFGVR